MANTPLHSAGEYHRRVGASLERIWENVFDWEHLAYLHNGSFQRCELLAEGEWGWRARLVLAGRPAEDGQTIELRADRVAGRYCSTTLSGAAVDTEIRVALTYVAEHETDVTVEFHLPESDPTRLAVLGVGYKAAYARLWDEDEDMMRQREAALSRPRGVPTRLPLRLGPEGEVRSLLPLPFEWAGEPWRLVELDGELTIHSTICPHWLGPLDDAPVVDGAVRCPWHGYRFDVQSGRCLTKPELRLRPAPSVVVSSGDVWVSGEVR